MAGKQFELTPREVPQVETKYRRIKTAIPVPESIPILEDLRRYEPVSMTGQPLVVWDRAEGCQVYDKWGNMWLDWSCGVLVTSIGHGRKELVDAVVAAAQKPLLHNYCFPNEIRARLTRKLVEMTPAGFDKVFLLTTGSEATECCFKLARTHGRAVGGDRKIGIVAFENAFHGRTLGGQMMGGSPAAQEWIVNIDPSIWHVPFPDGYWCEDTSFDLFLKSLADQGVTPDMVAGVISESYQGGGASFFPMEYAQKLRQWCSDNDIVLMLDEVQAGFGRTGQPFGFMHYGVTPDLIACGKGISGGMPVSAVIGRGELLDQYPPGSMTSTHTGNPVCCSSALANLELVEAEKPWENAARIGEILAAEFRKMQEKYPIIGSVQGRGCVFALHIVKEGRKEADYDMAFDIVKRCVEKGLLFFSPVGKASVKVAPPLIITEEQVLEGCQVLDEAFGEVLAEA